MCCNTFVGILLNFAGFWQRYLKHLGGCTRIMSALSKMEKSQIEFLLKDSNDSLVAKQFGVTRQAVWAIRKKFDLPSSRTGAQTRKLKILELRRDGLSVAKISATVNMSQSYVYKVLQSRKQDGKGVDTPNQDLERSEVEG